MLITYNGQVFKLDSIIFHYKEKYDYSESLMQA